MHLQGYGCAGTNAVAYGLACLELEAGDSGVRSMVSVQGSLAMFAIWKFGSEEQKQKWLPRMAAGEAIGCFGLTEPDFGSNPAGMRTRAKRDGDDWVLNGTQDVDHQRLGRRRGRRLGAEPTTAIRGFVVPTDTAGFSAPKISRKLSLRASVTSELVLEDVRLPGRRGAARGHRPARTAVVPERGPLRDRLRRAGCRPGLPGDGDRLRAAPGRCSTVRSPSFQLTQAKLADMALELQKGFLLALHLGRLKDEHRLRARARSAWASSTTSGGAPIARECRTILGANGITLEYPVMRHANNLESVLTYEGTSEVHQLVIGQALTGENAFSCSPSERRNIERRRRFPRS